MGISCDVVLWKIIPFITDENILRLRILNKHYNELIYSHKFNIYFLNKWFRYICMHGHINIVKKLLKKTNINPNDDSRCYRSPLQHACIYGHLEIVKILLNDSRINPSDHNNGALQMALRHNHPKIIKELMKDPRVNCIFT